jgi:hypothetical protein
LKWAATRIFQEGRQDGQMVATVAVVMAVVGHAN